MKNFKLFYLLFFIFIASCESIYDSSNSNNTSITESKRILDEIKIENSCRDYRYLENFKIYLEEINFNFKTSKNHSIIILPANSCSPCLNKSIENLLINPYDKNDLDIIIANASTLDTVKNPQFIKLLTHYKECHIDSTRLIFEYHLGIGEPTLIYFDNVGLSYMVDLTYPNWKKIDELIRQ